MPKYRKQTIDYDIVPALYDDTGKEEKKDITEIEIVSDAGKLTFSELEKQILDCIMDFYRNLYGNDVTNKYIIEKSKNNTWRGCMTYVNQRIIKKIKTRATRGDAEISSNGNNALSLDTIEQLAYIYNHLCNIYNKPQSIMAFSHLCGISNMIVELWGHADAVDEVTRRRKHIYKIIIGERLESITTRLFDGGAAPIGTIAVFNQEILGGKAPEQIGYTSVDALPKLKD